MSLSLPGVMASDCTIFNNILSKSTNLKVGHFNAQSIGSDSSKFLEIYNLIHNSNLNIICISETWLKDIDSINSIYIPGYKLVRCDRSGRRGGGGLMYISENYSFKILYNESYYENDSHCFEILFVEVVIGCERYCIGVTYIPPKSSILMIEYLISNFSSRYSNFILV